jgi:hypothetical protein
MIRTAPSAEHGTLFESATPGALMMALGGRDTLRIHNWLLLCGLLMMAGGSLLAHRVQTAGGIRVEDVRFTGTGGTAMGAFLIAQAKQAP